MSWYQRNHGVLVANIVELKKWVNNKSGLLTLWLSCTCLGKRLAMDSYSACTGSKFLPENFQRTVLSKRLSAFCVCNGTSLEAFLSHSPFPSHSYLLQNRNIANKPTPWILEVTSLLSKKIDSPEYLLNRKRHT